MNTIDTNELLKYAFHLFPVNPIMLEIYCHLLLVLFSKVTDQDKILFQPLSRNL